MQDVCMCVVSGVWSRYMVCMCVSVWCVYMVCVSVWCVYVCGVCGVYVVCVVCICVVCVSVWCVSVCALAGECGDFRLDDL